MIFKSFLFLFVAGTLVTWTTPQVEAVDTATLHRDGLYKRSEGRRIDRSKLDDCAGCDDKTVRVKVRYLERVLLSGQSTSYKSKVQAQLLKDERFRNGCWSKNVKKGIDLFFTISTSGTVKDIAWFPEERSGKCMRSHVKSIVFPKPDKTHYAWFMVNEIVSNKNANSSQTPMKFTTSL
jgi:hypothetical protein